MADSKQISRSIVSRLGKIDSKVIALNTMRVVIWVLRKDVVSNNITEFHVNSSEIKDKYDPTDYVQVVVSREEFDRLESTL